MLKKSLLIIISYFLLYFNLSAGSSFTMEWFWGIESISKEQYFILNLKPELNFNFFALKLDIPVEINNNKKIFDNHWNSKYDIITKIDYLTFTNRIFYFKIQTLNNISLGNGELIYDYSNDLFQPLLIKKGLINVVKINFFQSTIVIDDLNDNDLFFIDLSFIFKAFKTGTVFAYDHDILDPYKEKSADNNKRISSVNVYANYKILTKKKLNLTIQNDLIKHIKTYKSKNNLIFASGLDLKYSGWLNFKTKLKYYQKKFPEQIVFNKFYEIERGAINNNIIKKGSFGVSTLSSFYFKKYFSLAFFIEKAERLFPYTSIKLRTLEDFPTKIKFYSEIYNRLNKKWYQMFFEREKDSFVVFKSSIPLSEHLSLNLNYLKSFKYKNNNLRGLHQVLIYSEFIF